MTNLTFRPASPQDADNLVRLAALDSAQPLTGDVLLAEARGRPVAALSLVDGRAVADPFEPTALDGLVEIAEEDPELAAEVEETLASVEERLEELELERLFSGRYDAGDALVTVNSGAGGTDAQDWAEMLLRMEMRWAERRGFKTELVEVSEGEEAGIKTATFLVHGENAYGLYQAEKGVHRLVRISPFDAQSRRHTSFSLVEVSPLVDEVTDVDIAESDLQIDTYRASGAGGQHVNKTDSAVGATPRPT